MARIRTIKPEYWDDEIVGSVSIPARLLFPATWNFADDEGLVNWSAAYLKGAAFRYDQNVTVEHVAAWMQEIEDAGFVYAYSTSRARHRIAFVINFRDHQRIDKPQPAKLPVPNWRDPNVAMVYARRDDFLCAHCSEMVNETFARDMDGRRYDPVCQRIKSPAERPGGPDDPSNIQIVHVMCAKDFDPSAPLGPIRGPFGERSQNDPGTIQEGSSVPVSPDSPVPLAIPAPVTLRSEAPGEPAGQVILGTFHERSEEEGKGREGKRKGREEPPSAPDALFSVDTPDEPPSARADKPRGSTAKGGKPKSDKPNPHAVADGLTRAFYDTHKQRLTQPYVALLKIIRVPIANGTDRDDLARALDILANEGTAISGGTIRTAMTRVEQARGARPAIPAQRPSATTTRTQTGLNLMQEMAAEEGIDLADVLPFARRGITA